MYEVLERFPARIPARGFLHENCKEQLVPFPKRESAALEEQFLLWRPSVPERLREACKHEPRGIVGWIGCRLHPFEPHVNISGVLVGAQLRKLCSDYRGIGCTPNEGSQCRVIIAVADNVHSRSGPGTAVAVLALRHRPPAP